MKQHPWIQLGIALLCVVAGVVALSGVGRDDPSNDGSPDRVVVGPRVDLESAPADTPSVEVASVVDWSPTATEKSPFAVLFSPHSTLLMPAPVLHGAVPSA